MQKFFVTFLILSAGVLFFFWLSFRDSSVLPYTPDGVELSRAYLGVLPLKVEIVSTDEGKRQGLSGRISLASDQGMLFVFDRPQVHSFWMKDMHFPIDMIWLDENYRVVDVTHDAQPSSYPATFSPKIPAQYVLEVNAGLAESFNVGVGTLLSFSKNF